jgi:phosphotransferase system IIA component
MDKDIIIKNLQEQIEELKIKLEMEDQVKKGEVIINIELQQRIESKEVQIEEIIKINKKLVESIAELRVRLKKLIIKTD